MQRIKFAPALTAQQVANLKTLEDGDWPGRWVGGILGREGRGRKRRLGEDEANPRSANQAVGRIEASPGKIVKPGHGQAAAEGDGLEADARQPGRPPRRR